MSRVARYYHGKRSIFSGRDKPSASHLSASRGVGAIHRYTAADENCRVTRLIGVKESRGELELDCFPLLLSPFLPQSKRAQGLAEVRKVGKNTAEVNTVERMMTHRSNRSGAASLCGRHCTLPKQDYRRLTQRSCMDYSLIAAQA
jgi:hypothetical protein